MRLERLHDEPVEEKRRRTTTRTGRERRLFQFAWHEGQELYRSGECRDWRKVKTQAWREANRERWRLFREQLLGGGRSKRREGYS